VVKILGAGAVLDRQRERTWSTNPGVLDARHGGGRRVSGEGLEGPPLSAWAAFDSDPGYLLRYGRPFPGVCQAVGSVDSVIHFTDAVPGVRTFGVYNATYAVIVGSVRTDEGCCPHQ